MAMPIVAIVGRANVGKSALFNRLVGERKSITMDVPGVTRDRIYGDCEWQNKTVSLVDTGGLDIHSHDVMLGQIKHQVEIAIEQADVIIFVVDLKTGITAQDSEIAEMLRRINKPVMVAVNKCDHLGEPAPEFYEFYNLGFDKLLEVSATQGYGIGDLLDAVFAHVNFVGSQAVGEKPLKISVVGRPNVGKSSLVNRISNEERTIVSEVAGTTRDATDTLIENKHGRFVFVDTAGIRKKKRVEEDLEYFSVIRAFKAVDNSDVCLMLIDANEGPSEQDTKIAGYTHGKGKAIIIVVNKWDMLEKEAKTINDYKGRLEATFAFMSYVPFCFVSVKTGQRIDTIFEAIKRVYDQNSRRIATGTLNAMLAEAVTKVQPPSDRGRHLKIYYITQIGVNPPTFVVFVNHLNLLRPSYKRYLENQIRKVFELNLTPLILIARERREKGKQE
ncbi:MAG: ribosome biogenesis GTPase Der [Oscillospiraceae bacterium]|nr:ribosome biogenesis GTPase Der [Oscillospiraceae bacterium]